MQYTFGSFDQHRVMADATSAITKDKKLKYRLVVGYENTGMLDKNQKIQNIFLAPQLQYDFSDKTSVNYELNYSNDNRTMGFQRGVPALQLPDGTWDVRRFPRNTSMIDPNGFSNTRTLSNQLMFTHKFSDDVKFTLLARSTHSQQTQVDLGPGQFSTGAINDSMILTNNYGKDRPFAYQVSAFANIKKSLFNIENNVVIGGDFSYSYRNYVYGSLDSRVININNPQFGWGIYNYNDAMNQGRAQEYTFGLPYAANEYTRLAALYIQDQIKISEQFKLLLGGRIESHRFRQNFVNPFRNDSVIARDTLTAIAPVPRVGIVYQPLASISIYASYTQGFQPQWGSNRGGGGPFGPERSRQYEVGSKNEWIKGKLMTTVAVYYIQKFDVLTTDPTDSSGFRLMKIDNVTSRGIEFSVQGNPTKNINLIANYAYNEARTPGDAGYDYNSPGWFPNAPNHSANAWAKYNFTEGMLKGLGFGAGFTHVGLRHTFTPGFTIPAYTTFDAALSYKYKNYTANLNLYNLTDEWYFNGVYGPANLWPGNPRSFRLAVSALF